LPAAVPFVPASSVLTIGNLEPSGIYYQSGLRPGDVVLSSYGIPVQTEAAFQQVASQHLAQSMPLVIRRGGKQQTIEIRAQQSPVRLGVRFDTGAANAALVTSVAPGSPAEVAGLRPDDIITSLNGRRISTYQQAMQVLSTMQPGDGVDIRFIRRVENATRATLDLPSNASVRTAAYPPDARADGTGVPAAQAGQMLPK